MTAEIAVMNKSGIALAADSAVTIDQSNERGDQKRRIYNTVNKLFTLSKYEPVGIMIFGNADLMGVPWEVIIKLYRKQLGSRLFDTMQEYATDFIAFLEDKRNLFSSATQDHFARLQIVKAFLVVVGEVQKAVKQAFTGDDASDRDTPVLTEEEIVSLTNETIAKVCNEWQESPDLSSSSDEYRNALHARYSEFIEMVIPDIFKESPIDEASRNLLHNAAVDVLTKDVLEGLFGNDGSGVVIAGYGDANIYPVLQSLEIRSVLDGKVQYKRDEAVEISEDTSAAIIPFAQPDMVHTL